MIKEKIKQNYKIDILKERLTGFEQVDTEKILEENQEYKEKVKELENKLFTLLEDSVSKIKGNVNLKKLNIKLIDYVKDVRKDVDDIDLFDVDRHLDLLDNVFEDKDEDKKPKKKTNKDKKSKKKDKGGGGKQTFY